MKKKKKGTSTKKGKKGIKKVKAVVAKKRMLKKKGKAKGIVHKINKSNKG